MRTLILSRITLFVIAAALPAPASGQPDTVRIDLTSTCLRDALPFDKPFALVGTAPSGVFQAQIDLLCVEVGKIPGSADEAWVGASAHHATARPDREARLRFPLPALEANSLYAFRVLLQRHMAPEGQAILRQRIKPLVEEAVWDVPLGSVSASDLMDLGTRFLGIAQGVVGRDTVVADGTLFDPELPQDSFEARVAHILRPIQEGRGQSAAAQEQGNVALASAALAWTEVVASEDLREFTRILAEWLVKGNESKSLAEAGLEFSVLTDGEVEAIIQGVRSDSSEPSPEGLESRAGLLQAALDRLATLQQQLRSLTDRRGENYQIVRQAVLRGPLPQSRLDGVRALQQQASFEPPTTRPDGDLWKAADQLLAAVEHFKGAAAAEQRLKEVLSDDLVAAFEVVSQQVSVRWADTSVAYGTHKGKYVSADAGLAWAPTIAAFVPYVGANYYFHPVNRSVPLSRRGGVGYRFSLMAGLTMKSVADTVRGRSDLFGSSAFVLGFGLRVTESIRMGGGALVFNSASESPFDMRTALGAEPYLNLSIDINVAATPDLLKNLFK